MTRRRETERELRAENRRIKSALSAIHDRLHADDIDGAHQACECALGGGTVTQPNLHAKDSAAGIDFAAAFNALADQHRVRACCVTLVPSSTVKGATSIQICGEVTTCKVVESLLSGKQSLYMGDHSEPSAAQFATAFNSMAHYRTEREQQAVAAAKLRAVHDRKSEP